MFLHLLRSGKRYVTFNVRAEPHDNCCMFKLNTIISRLRKLTLFATERITLVINPSRRYKDNIKLNYIRAGHGRTQSIAQTQSEYCHYLKNLHKIQALQTKRLYCRVQDSRRAQPSPCITLSFYLNDNYNLQLQLQRQLQLLFQMMRV